mgnify:CR=1 FL=1|jgi:hypothetical protein
MIANPRPLAPYCTTSGVRTVPAGSTEAQAILQAGLLDDAAPRAWAVNLVGDGVVAGSWTITAGDYWGQVVFQRPFVLGQTFDSLTVAGRYVSVKWTPAASTGRDYQVGATVGLFSQQ